MTKEEWIKKYKKKTKEFDEVLDFVLNKYGHKKSFNFTYDQALENYKNVNKIYSIESENLVLIRLRSDEDKIQEGHLMNNCLRNDQDSYKKSNNLYSFRLKTTNKPIATVQINSKEIKQIKGHSNGPIPHEYHEEIMETLSKNFNKKINFIDEYKIGIHKINKKTLNILKENFSGYKTYTMGTTNYLLLKPFKMEKKFKGKAYDLLMAFIIKDICKEGLRYLVEYVSQRYHKNYLPYLHDAVRSKNKDAMEFILSEYLKSERSQNPQVKKMEENVVKVAVVAMEEEVVNLIKQGLADPDVIVRYCLELRYLRVADTIRKAFKVQERQLV